ncbi:MAG: UDP-N-acetylmuramate--L-alanine ligase, partial [Bdellovibrionales bacterium]|nr:UDP-N-acetylmuramate--L-alanine ligase [Bdellovibrionales bacterium]
MKLAKARVHFIGIGGIGMCGLAELLHNMGAHVTGSDLGESAQTERLKSLGIKVFKGHTPENVEEAEVVVFSSAVKESNPEYTEARRRRIPLIRRAEALAEIMLLKRGIAVGGTHGKTTTTSLTASAFLAAGGDPTICVGGRLDLIKSTAQLGKGEWMIAEADESDGSFNKLSPEIAIITNIDSDHMDYYKTFENLQRAFYEFALKVPFYGVNIVYGDDQVTRTLFDHFPKKIWFYGFNPDNDFWLKGERGKYEVYFNNKKKNKQELIGELILEIPGRHNALNSLASLMVAYHCGLNLKEALDALKKYKGVDRRFQFKGEKNSIKVYDDYGHHPTEVRAVLEAFKEKFPQSRLVTLFQPHRYSRTQSCWNEFLNCFYLTDIL